MSDKLPPPDDDAPKRRVWKTWKWVGLLVLVVTLATWNRLPGSIAFLGTLFGLVAAVNLGFLFLRYLKGLLFWRVRNRILISFIFVGLIPLLLTLGIALLVSRLLLGQLAANYVEISVAELQRELSWINVELASQISAAAVAEKASLERLASRADQMHDEKFPRLSYRLSRRLSEGSFETVWKSDRHGIEKETDDYPVDKWLDGRPSFEGLLATGSDALLKTLRPVPQLAAYYLDLTAPLDQHLERRLQRDRSVYVTFMKPGSVVVSGNAIQVQGNSVTGAGPDPALVARLQELEQRSSRDTRRMVTWVTVLQAQNYLSGQKSGATLVILHVPLATLYQVYLAGSYQIGDFVTNLIMVLLGVIAFTVMSSLAFGVTITRRITKSIHDMYEGTLALQQGDLKHRIPVRRKDQLGLLAHSFNQMSASMVRLLEEVTEKKRLEQELEIAREVQATLFPKQLPHPRGLSVYGGCVPARVVSGDYYDFVVESETHMHIVVSDISGKGISAALLMANLQAAMRNQLLTLKQGSRADRESSLAEVFRQLNQQIYRNSPSEKYATLFCAGYNAETRCLCYCNAGHLPPLLLSDGKVERLETGGTVLGLFEDASYEAASVALAAGTMIAVYTDGITEAVNGAGEEFGERRFVEALRQSRGLSAEAIYKHVIERVQQWQGALQQHDDITLIVGKVEG